MSFIYILLALMLTHANDQVFFSPHGGCEEEVIKLIQKTSKTLDVAMYSLNNKKIITALKEAKQKGVKVKILLDRSQAFVNRESVLELKNYGFDVKIHSVNRIQHNKFMVSDSKKIETGSFNWTEPAENKNEENCLFSDTPKLVNAFQQRFNEHLWIVNTISKSQAHFDKLKKSVTRKSASVSTNGNKLSKKGE